MTENTPPIVAGLAKTRLVKTTDHKYARILAKIHNSPRPNNNQKSTLVMTENTPPIAAGLAKTRLVKTTDHKYARILAKIHNNPYARIMFKH